MPIIFADKKKRLIAAIHCGRKGLEKKIIKKLIKIFDNQGSCRNDLIVAIGPSITKENYFIDRYTLEKFYKKVNSKNLYDITKNTFDLRSSLSQKKEKIHIDLRKYAYIQLINENIPHTSIEISSLCTYELVKEFHSWRRNKTLSRQWNFICQ
tara:strand:+ start:1385 stop:1843 length:459 start_codon:yes stop_codon:yes gene_type:complete